MLYSSLVYFGDVGFNSGSSHQPCRQSADQEMGGFNYVGSSNQQVPRIALVPGVVDHQSSFYQAVCIAYALQHMYHFESLWGFNIS
jgi:hypothetical protein